MRKLLGWDRYDTHEAVEAINNLYCNELRLWLNLYLPSVKLVKKVRVGSKVRRVYDGPRTPFERVKACPQADREKVARLEELRKSLDPFQLGKIIERKLARISRLANRRQSPRAEQPGEAKTSHKAVEKTLALRAWESLRDSHFPPAPTTTKFRLHYKCLDNPSYSYILKCLDRESARTRTSLSRSVPTVTSFCCDVVVCGET